MRKRGSRNRTRNQTGSHRNLEGMSMRKPASAATSIPCPSTVYISYYSFCGAAILVHPEISWQVHNTHSSNLIAFNLKASSFPLRDLYFLQLLKSAQAKQDMFCDVAECMALYFRYCCPAWLSWTACLPVLRNASKSSRLARYGYNGNHASSDWSSLPLAPSFISPVYF